jgi:putative RNA 2'-phosphotransferase
MQLDPEGWLNVDELITNANANGKSITLEQLREVVASNDQQRFTLSDDGLRIRASDSQQATL